MTDGDPTMLGMINENVKEIKSDVKEMRKELKEGAVKMENHSGRLKHIEKNIKELSNGQKKIKETIWNHSNNKKTHYNQGFKETFPQRTWRRKDLIALMTGIFTTITLIINHFIRG